MAFDENNSLIGGDLGKLSGLRSLKNTWIIKGAKGNMMERMKPAFCETLSRLSVFVLVSAYNPCFWTLVCGTVSSRWSAEGLGQNTLSPLAGTLRSELDWKMLNVFGHRATEKRTRNLFGRNTVCFARCKDNQSETSNRTSMSVTRFLTRPIGPNRGQLSRKKKKQASREKEILPFRHFRIVLLSCELSGQRLPAWRRNRSSLTVFSSGLSRVVSQSEILAVDFRSTSYSKAMHL